MVMGARRNVTKTIDMQISELIPELSDRRYTFKMPENQRLRHFCGVEYVQGDSRILRQMVSVRISANDLVELYLSGVEVTGTAPKDILSYYGLLRNYLLLWAKRSHALPDEPMPPISDFTNVDDYLKSIHADWYVRSVIENGKEPQKQSNFRSRRFSDVDTGAVESPLARPTEYESAIDMFHQNVWRTK